MGLPPTPVDAYFSDPHLPSVNLANDFSLAQNSSTNFRFQEMKHEAQSSSLLIIANTHYKKYIKKSGSKLPYDLACPALVVPEGEERIEHIFLIDDGQPDTHRRIKQIADLFTDLCLAIPTTLLLIDERCYPLSRRDEKIWVRYLRLHFTNLAIYRIMDQVMDVPILSLMLDDYQNVLLIESHHSLVQLIKPLKSFKRFRLITAGK